MQRRRRESKSIFMLWPVLTYFDTRVAKNLVEILLAVPLYLSRQAAASCKRLQT